MFKHDRSSLFILPLALILIPFLLWPALFGLLASFTTYAPAELHPLFVGLANYSAILHDHEFQIAVRNIGLFALVVVPVELGLGFALAYALRQPFRGRSLLRIFLLLPWLVSPIAHGVMWHFLFSAERGIVNFWPGWLGLPEPPSPLGLAAWALPALIVTDIWRKAPFASFLLLPGVLAIPAEMWDQGTIEGTSLLGRFHHIAWPWTRPLFFTVALLLIGDTLGTFDTVLMLTGGGPGTQTLTPALYSFQRAFKTFDWPIGATSAWLVVAAVLIVGVGYLFMTRRGWEVD